MADIMSAGSSDTAQANLFDRILCLEKHEYIAVGWSFAYFFCVLSAYYMLRPVRETMAVESGVANVPWLFSSTFVVMLIASTIFAWVASRYPRRQFLPWVYLFFVVNILLFYAVFTIAIENDSSFVWIGRAFFVWLSVFNLFVVSVFWSFMADIYSREQGRRLFGIISAGGSAGALLGPLVVSMIVVRIGFQNLLPISAALLLVAVFCITRLRNWLESEHRDDGIATVDRSRLLGGNAFDGIGHVLSSPYLGSIVAATVIASLMGTALYMFQTELVGQAVTGADNRTQTFGYIDGATNLLALIGQLFLVNRSVKRFGVGVTLAILPVISLVGFALLAINPALIVVAVLQAVRRGIGFGFSKPTSDMLYSVVTPAEKYKAKNFIETAVYRGGDVVGSWVVTFIWALGITGIAIVMLPFAVIWALIGLWLGRNYRRRDKLGMGVET
jgi:AAA family ATP:ADP antiporter